MKKIICAVLASGMLLAGLSVRAHSQEKTEKEEGGRRGEFAEKLKERLGLSDEQSAKIKAAWEAEKAAIKPLREQGKEGMRRLEEQVRGLASDKDISATLDQLDANRKALMAEHQKMESAMASALKPFQRAKMRLMMAHERKTHRGGDRGGWGGEESERHEPRGRDGEKRERGDENDDD